jgi:hypothetical protein
MNDPVSSAAAASAASGGLGGGFLLKIAAVFGLVSAGVLGAVFMSFFDPPKDRKTQFLQGFVAGTSSLICSPIVVKLLDHYSDWLDLKNATPFEAFEAAAPVYLVVGALSWGGFAAMAKLRQIIHERGADKVAGKIGL